ncbi:PorP/SprF family type IX secretion system membrane protein [Arundinibacter roseus]|nr:type IX secretion system membrane protein PorP/SprF [Arundinibacter roseus]
MRVKALLLFGWLVGQTVWAQQLPQGSLYSQNPFVVNPALTGAYDFADVRIQYRRQWQGLDDAPNTAFLTAHTPIGYGDKTNRRTRSPRYSVPTSTQPLPPAGSWRWGVGAVLMADQTGPTERNSAQLTAAAHLSLPNQWIVSAGIGGGILQYSLRFDRIQTGTPSDPILPDGQVSLLKPYVTVGLLARKGNFWGGVSVLSPKALSLAYAVPSGEISSQLLPHTFVTAAYRFALGEQWAVIPQLWLKRVGKAPVSVDAQVRIQAYERLWAGFNYRFQDSAGATLGMALSPAISLNYAYDYPLSAIRVATAGSHELMLAFKFNNRTAIYCPPMGW